VIDYESNSPQAEFVVRLRREQAVAKLHHGRQLLREDLRLLEPAGAEGELGDHGEIGVGHGDRPEENLLI